MKVRPFLNERRIEHDKNRDGTEKRQKSSAAFGSICDAVDKKEK